MDIGAARGMGGVEGIAWGVKVVGAAWEVAEISEAGDGGAAQGRAIRPPAVAVGPPAPVPWVGGPLGLTVRLANPVPQAV
jgi:hypothetical protein